MASGRVGAGRVLYQKRGGKNLFVLRLGNRFRFFSINIFVLLIHTVPLLSDAGLTRNEASFAMLVASVPAMISKPIWGYWIDRTAPKPLAAMSAAVTGVALFLIVYATASSGLFWIYAAYAVLGLGWGGMIPMQEVIWASFLDAAFWVRFAVPPCPMLWRSAP